MKIENPINQPQPNSKNPTLCAYINLGDFLGVKKTDQETQMWIQKIQQSSRLTTTM